MTRISIVIPNLNQAAKLDRCLKTLVSQAKGLDFIEIMVVDNGSNDKSIAVIEQNGVKGLSYAVKQSPYAARNYGIQQANGEVICLIDSKCLPSDEYIAELILQEKKENWDMVGGKFTYLGLTSDSSISEIAYAMLFLKTDPKYFSGRASALTGNMVVRKHVFDQIGYFDERRAGGDIDFLNRAYENGLDVIYNPKLLAGYEPLEKNDIINSIIRNKKYAFNKMKFTSLRPPGIKYFRNRLNDLDLSIGISKQLRLYFFIWRLRFIKYFTRTITP